MCFEKKHEQITEYPLYLHEDEKGNTEIIGRKGRKVRRLEMGGGMPEGGDPYQQLVTDGEGNAKWEDRLAYSEEQGWEYIYNGNVADDITDALGSVATILVTDEITTLDDLLGATMQYEMIMSGGVPPIAEPYVVASSDVKAEQGGLAMLQMSINFPGVTSFNVTCAIVAEDVDFGNGLIKKGFYAEAKIAEGDYTLFCRSISKKQTVTKPISPEYLAAEHGANKVLVTDGSGVAKWEDRLAYSEEGVVIEWDGNTEGLENHTISLMGQQFLTWHVSDAVIDRANRDGLSVTFADGEEEILTEDDYYAELDTDEYYIIAEEAFMVEKAGVFPSSGVWFIDRTSPNLLKIEEPSTVHKIDPKYIPEGVGGGGIPTYIIFTDDESNFMLLKSDGNTVLSEEEVLALPWTEGMFVFMDVAFVDATIPSNYRCLQATYNAGGINMSYMRLDFKNDVALSVNLDTGEIGWAQDA